MTLRPDMAHLEWKVAQFEVGVLSIPDLSFCDRFSEGHHGHFFGLVHFLTRFCISQVRPSLTWLPTQR